MYRPSNWENPHRGRTLKVHCLDGLITTEPRDDEAVHAMIFEAGADAMLKSLIETGRPMEAGDYEDYWDTEVEWHHAHERGKGYLVWIPNDTEKEE